MGWNNTIGPILSPRNSIRDVILAIDTSTANGTRTLFTVPDAYDLYLTKLVATVVAPMPKIIRILNTPPGEHPALFHSAPNGFSGLDFHANPLLLAPKTVFALDTDILSGEMTYQQTTLWGVLIPTDPNNWS
jgi:hypothetical protein